MAPTQICEAAMLVCFGTAWPLSNLRMLRSGRVEGRGLLPTGLVLAGYGAGMLAKLLAAGALPPLFWLYLLNSFSVGLNLALQWHYGRRAGAVPTRPAQGALPHAT
jgi:hypothetical protein